MKWPWAITVDVLFKEIFRILIEERRMSKDDLIDFLKCWPLLDERNTAILSVGIERFFARDYISALHILVPQFESCLRRMFAQALSHDINKARRNSTRADPYRFP